MIEKKKQFFLRSCLFAVIISLCTGKTDPVGGEKKMNEQLERFIAAAERMRLDEYVRFESDRRRRLRDAFFQGMARGLGAMIGFAFLGTIVLLILQEVAKRKLPVISDFVAQVITLVQMRIK